MTTLEALLHSRLVSDPDLQALLAVHGGQPAIFELMAPPDDDEGWTGPQTPRVEYFVRRQEDPARHMAGSVTLTVIDRGESFDRVDAIEARLRELLDGAVFQPEAGTVSLRWSTFEQFDQDPDYRGVEVVYDLIAWPSHLTYSPDPIAALRDFSTSTWPELRVDPLTWGQTDEAPALYWRLASLDITEETQWGAWVQARIQGHLLTPQPSARATWIRRVAEGLALARRLHLSDGSPLFILNIDADSEADPLRAGQLRVTARFGVLRPPEGWEVLNKAWITISAGG